MSHLLRRPETFFTPSHTMLYAGIGLLVIGAIVGATLLLKNKEIRTKYKCYIDIYNLLICINFLYYQITR
jgi:hypothetical protein